MLMIWSSKLRFAVALLAGAVAITLNIVILAAADLVPLATAHGGLLRLLSYVTEGSLPARPGPVVQLAFHAGVGLAMAEVYAFALESALPGPPWVRGLIYAAVAWIANAAIVLPLTGEGFAGSRHLTFPGMCWFAVAHILFFVLQAVIFARLAAWHGHRQG